MPSSRFHSVVKVLDERTGKLKRYETEDTTVVATVSSSGRLKVTGKGIQLGYYVLKGYLKREGDFVWGADYPC